MTKNDNGPCFMLNALWFKSEGGIKMYQKYIEAALPILSKYGAKLKPAFNPLKAVIGEFDADLIFFVEYPSWEIFKQMISDPAYKKIRHFREEAITKSLLIKCKRAF